MKKQLIKAVEPNGDVWYHTVHDGNRVTPYTKSKDQAIKDFKAFKPGEPVVTIIMEEEI